MANDEIQLPTLPNAPFGPGCHSVRDEMQRYARAAVLADREKLAQASASEERPNWCDTMERPKERCGCPDCGSSLIDIGGLRNTSPGSGTMPALPRELLDQLGEYGMARTDGVSPVEINHRWAQVIDGIKRYAASQVAPVQDVAPMAEVVVNEDRSQTWIALRTQWLPVGTHKLYATPPAAGQDVAPSDAMPITWSIMVDDGGETPAYCLMAAFRSEAAARAALASMGAAPQAVAPAAPLGWMSDQGAESLRKFGQASIIAGPARSQLSEYHIPIYAAPQPAASAAPGSWRAFADWLTKAHPHSFVNPENMSGWIDEYAATAQPQPSGNAGELGAALRLAEAALADIGDADREPSDDVAWCEQRAAQALPAVRSALRIACTTQPSGRDAIGSLSSPHASPGGPGQPIAMPASAPAQPSGQPGTRIGRATTRGGRVQSYAFEQTDLLDGEHAMIVLAAQPSGQAAPSDTHAFKNFHRALCDRFGYSHDERDWRRDQVSLIEWIAAQTSEQAQSDHADWMPFALTLSAALDRGEPAALLMDENSPLRGELRRLIADARAQQQGGGHA